MPVFSFAFFKLMRSDFLQFSSSTFDHFNFLTLLFFPEESEEPVLILPE